MKVAYEVLYKNGHIDSYEVHNATEEQVLEVNEVIIDTLKSERGGYITLGDGETGAKFIRMAEVIRVDMQILEDLND